MPPALLAGQLLTDEDLNRLDQHVEKNTLATAPGGWEWPAVEVSVTPADGHRPPGCPRPGETYVVCSDGRLHLRAIKMRDKERRKCEASVLTRDPPEDVKTC